MRCSVIMCRAVSELVRLILCPKFPVIGIKNTNLITCLIFFKGNVLEIQVFSASATRRRIRIFDEDGRWESMIPKNAFPIFGFLIFEWTTKTTVFLNDAKH